MSRTHRFLDGVFFAYLTQFLALAVGLWQTPYLLRHLAQHDYGLWLTGFQILGLLQLADFGILALIPREVAFRSHSSIETGTYLSKQWRVVFWQAVLLSVVCAGIWWMPPASWKELRSAMGWLFAAVVVTFPGRIYPVVLEGLQDAAYLGRVRLAAWAAAVCVSMGMVYMGFGLFSLAAFWLTSEGLLSGLCFFRFTRTHAAIRRESSGALWPVHWKDFGQGFWVSVGKLGIMMTFGTELIVIAQVLGPAAVVPYSCTKRAYSVLINQPLVLLHSALPGLSELRAREDHGKIYEVILALLTGALMLGGLMVCVIGSLNRPFVSLWVSPDQYGGIALTLGFGAAMYLGHYSHMLNYALFCYHQERLLTLASIAEGILFWGGALLGLHFLGVAGVPLTQCAISLFVMIPLKIWYLSQNIGLSPKRFILPFIPLTLRIVVVTAMSIWMVEWIAPWNWLSISLCGVLVTGLYGAMIYPLTRRAPVDKYAGILFARIQSRFRPPATAQATEDSAAL